MKILVINCGSSSIKYKLFEMREGKQIAWGVVEEIGGEESLLKHEDELGRVEAKIKIKSHREGFKEIIKLLKRVIGDLSEIAGVGHRVVHGGERYFDATLIDDVVLMEIEKFSKLAPLHNPANLLGIRLAMEAFPNTPQVAVFDTAFHQTMPEEAYIYAIPYEYYIKYGIRRYGFHGTSHRYVALKAAEMLGVELEKLKLITCHLGNGASIAAIRSGKSIDTSMGFTPLEGLVMGTRCGDIDPSIIFFIAKWENKSLDEIYELLNKSSGLLGLSGVSNDVRLIREEASRGNERAKLALKVFAYRVKKYIGAYTAILGGLDALVFTAGIGENDPYIRWDVCSGLEFLGIELDWQRNLNPRKYSNVISSEKSRVKVLVIPTDEEYMIALDTYRLLRGTQR